MAATNDWWHPPPKVYYHIIMLEPEHSRVPFSSPGTPEGERMAHEYMMSLCAAAFTIGVKAVYTLVRITEFDIGPTTGQVVHHLVRDNVAVRQECVCTGWCVPPPPEVPLTPVIEADLSKLFQSACDGLDDNDANVDALLDSLINWDGVTA